LTYADITYPEDLPRNRELMAELAEGKRSAFTLEKRYCRKDGAPIWVQVTVSALPSEQGEPRLFVGVIEDITERRGAQEQLHRRRDPAYRHRAAPRRAGRARTASRHPVAGPRVRDADRHRLPGRGGGRALGRRRNSCDRRLPDLSGSAHQRGATRRRLQRPGPVHPLRAGARAQRAGQRSRHQRRRPLGLPLARAARHSRAGDQPGRHRHHHRGVRSGDVTHAQPAQPRMIRVFIADDHQLIRAGFRQLAAEDHVIEVVGEAAEGGELLRRLEQTRADVVILDIGMPGPGFVPLIRELRKRFPRVAVLVVSMHPEGQLALHALRAGAAGGRRQVVGRDCRTGYLVSPARCGRPPTPAGSPAAQIGATDVAWTTIDSSRDVQMRVFLVDDSTLVRVRLAAMLQDMWEVDNVVEAGTVAEALRLMPESKPDVVVVDMRLPDGDGLDVLRAAKQLEPPPTVVVLTN